MYKTLKYALVRGVPETYHSCVSDNPGASSIDVDLAQRQHQLYCAALEGQGLQLIKINPDNDLPDCCFVEDTAIIAGRNAIITRMDTPSRAPETAATQLVLERHMITRELKAPATLDGGDVMKIDKNIYIGLSTRTNQDAVEQVQALVQSEGYQVIPVKINDTLHLKSSCTYIGHGFLVLSQGHFDHSVFDQYKTITVPREEAYASNCLAVNGRVLIARGYPRTREMIEKSGFETIELDMTEFKKGNGSLTCLSILF